MRSRRSVQIALVVLPLLAAVYSGCGKPFNVRRKVDLPLSKSAVEGRWREGTIRADAVWDEDLLYDTFDANLIQAGVLAVNIHIKNDGSEKLSLSGLKLELQDENGRRFQRMSAKKTFKRMIDYYAISVYNKRGYQRALDDVTAYELDLKDPLEPGGRRSGLLFFDVKRSGLPARATLLLNRSSADKLDGAVRLELVRTGG